MGLLPGKQSFIHLSQLLLPGKLSWIELTPPPHQPLPPQPVELYFLHLCGAQTLMRILLVLDSPQVCPGFVPNRVVEEGQQNELECGAKGAPCAVMQIGWIGAGGVPSTRWALTIYVLDFQGHRASDSSRTKQEDVRHVLCAPLLGAHPPRP